MNRFSHHVQKMNEASVNLIPFVPVVKQLSTIGEAQGQQSKRWKAGTIQGINFQPFRCRLLLSFSTDLKNKRGPWEMPLFSAAAEVSLSTVAMVWITNPSHCHAGSLVTPSGRTESTSPQPRRTLGKQQISALKSLCHPGGKKDKDLGSSSFFLT